MRITAAALLLLLGASCAIPDRAQRAYHIPRDGEIEVVLEPAADRAVVTVERGLVDVVFRGPHLEMRAALATGGRRATLKRGSVHSVIVTARLPSLVTIQTEQPSR